MLFRSLSSYIPTNVSGRILSKLNGYVSTLNTKRQLITSRYQPMVGVETNCVRLIRKIFADADINNLLSKSSDISRYADVLQYTQNSLNNIFDSNMTGNIYSNMFIRKTTSTACDELIIPVSCSDIYNQLPFEQGWDIWASVRAVRLIDYDSNELTFNTYTDQIVFKRDIPSRAVIAIDVAALVLQYVNYRRYVKLDEQSYTPIYIHQFVLSKLLEDLENIWLRNQYTQIIKNFEIFNSRFDVTKMSSDNMYGFVGTQFPQAMSELYTYLTSCSVGNIKPDAMLASLPMSEGYVPEYLDDLLSHTVIPDQRQYKWAEYLRDIPWLDLMWYTYNLNPNFVQTRNLRNALNRDLPVQLSNNNIADSCRSQATRNFIKQDMKQRYEQTKK